MSRIREELRRLPLPMRHAVVAGAIGGVLGGLVGLVLGLVAHPATAWAAVVEVGLPAGLLGVVLGLLSGSIAWAVRRHRHRPATA